RPADPAAPGRDAGGVARYRRHGADLLYLQLERVLLRGESDLHERGPGAGVPGWLHHQRGALPGPTLRRRDPGVDAGAHRRVDSPEQARPRTVDGGREVRAAVISAPGQVSVETVDDPAPG